MAYITNSDIERRLGSAAYVQLTDDAGTGSADETVVDAARVAAEGEVDSYLARRHRVPIDVDSNAELAGLLSAATLDVVAFALHGRRPPIPEDVALRYRAVLSWLARVAEGAVVLPAAAPLAGNPATGISATAVGDEAVNSRSELEGL